MDVDSELDQSLLQQFSCMGTTDKEVLIAQLQKFIGNVNEASAVFFLDMNNWNLQAAICSYFDLETPNRLPSMSFVRDLTVGEGESVPPRTKFRKTWQVQNNGEDMWPPGCCLRFTQGDQLSASDRVLVESIPPGHTTHVSVDMTSPLEPGIYQSKWRMSTVTGSYFGDIIWVIITVAEGGTLAVTQQLSHLNDLGSSAPLSPGSGAGNPFASSRTPMSASQTLFQNSVQSEDGDANMMC